MMASSRGGTVEDIFHERGNTFLVICPNCNILSFDPKQCIMCKSEIPSSVRIKIMTRNKQVYEITGFEYKKFSTSTFANLKATPSPWKRLKLSRKFNTEGPHECVYGNNCACFTFLKTEEEVKESLKPCEEKIPCSESDSLYQRKEVSLKIRKEVPLKIRKEVPLKIKKEVADELPQHASEEHNSHPVPSSSSLVKSAVVIYDKDLDSLKEGKLLNDNVIDSYLNYVYQEVIPPEFQALTHLFSACFNMFLMRVFEDNKSPNKNRLELEKSVKKWVKNVDIFSKDFIFVPINRHEHWYLAVICFITQLNQDASESKESTKKISPGTTKKDHPYLQKGKTCICFFDSWDKRTTLKNEKIRIAETLKKFLKVLWDSKNQDKPCDWDSLLYIKAVCPQQPEKSPDCGLYLLQYVESFFKKPIPSFETKVLELKNWFSKSIMNQKRKQVKEVLSQMRIKQPQYELPQCGSDIVILSSEE